MKLLDERELPGADGEPFTGAAPVAEGHVVRVVFGTGSLDLVAAEARSLGSRVFLVSGRHADDAAAAVSNDLGAAVVGRVPRVVQHVPADLAREAADAAAQVGADVVVSVGGGSATGLAKAVALATGLPVLAVPTTYAGSEMTPIWGRTEQDGGGRPGQGGGRPEQGGGRPGQGRDAGEQSHKRTGRDWRVLPRVVVYDPALTTSMSPELTAASGMNALAHALEALYAPDATPRSSAVAEEAIGALARGLPSAVRRPHDLAPRAGTLRGAWLAGWALGSTTMGLHHRLAHVLGGRFGLPHADVHSALLPQVAAFNAASAPAAFERAARALGVSGPGAVGAALFALALDIGAPTSLAELGVRRRDLDVVVDDLHRSTAPNPRASGRDDVARVLLWAYAGEDPARSGAP